MERDSNEAMLDGGAGHKVERGQLCDGRGWQRQHPGRKGC